MSLYGVVWLDIEDSKHAFAAPPTQDMLCALCVIQKNSKDCLRCTDVSGWFVTDDDDDEAYMFDSAHD